MNKKLVVSLLVAITLVVIGVIFVTALSTVTLNTPASDTFIRGTYTLDATADATAENVSFYYVNASGPQLIGTNDTQGTSFILSWNTAGVPDGTYNITANATNSTGTIVSDTNTNVTVDNTDPSTALDSPAHNSWDADGTVVFTYTPTDTNIDTCILYHNVSSWGANTTNASLTSGAAVTITQSLSDGTYIWNVLCNDSAGNSAWANSTSNYTINVDNTDPVINGVTPANGSYFSSASMIFQASLTEANKDNDVNVTVYFRRQNVGSYQSATMYCAGTAPNYECNSTSKDLATLVGLSNGNVLEYFFNTTDLAGQAGENGSSSSPLTATLDTTDPVVNTLNNPTDDSWSTSKTVTFGFTATETNLDTCILYTNATGSWAANETLTSMTSGNAANFTAVTFASDGNILWNVLCNDSAGRTDWFTSNYTVKIDSTNPSVALDSPSDASWDADGSITFQYTPTETNIDTCILYTNVSGAWGANTTNTSLTSGAAVTITQSLADGTYIWNVLCNDSAGRTAWAAANYTINVDNTDPVVNSLSNYADGSWADTNSVTFGFNVTDTNIDTCILYTNATGSWAANVTKTSITSGADTDFAAITLADGNYIWNVLCNDSSGQEGWFTNNYTIHVDNTDPVVNSLDNPTDDSWSTSKTVTFGFTATDTNLDTCVLYTNATGSWDINQTKTDMTTAVAANFTAVTFSSDGTILWNVLCNDSANQEDWAAANYTVKIDSTNPVLSGPSPANGGYVSNASAVLFEISMTEQNKDNSVNATVYYRRNNTGSFVSSTLSCFGTAPDYTCNKTVDVSAKVTDGEILEYFFNTTDSAGLAGEYGNTSSTFTATVDSTNPVVNSLDNPTDDSWSTSRTVTFGFTATDTHLDTCVLYTNATGAWAVNQTKTDMTSGAAANFTAVTFASDGNILWNVWCNDTSGRTDWFTSNYTIKIDTVDPSITLDSPSDASWDADGTVVFTYTPTDTNIDTCILYHNVSSWAANTTNASLTSGAAVTITQSLADGTYIWNVLCNDSAGRTAWAAANYTINVDNTDPVVDSLDNPSDDSWSTSKTVIFGFTATEANFDTCVLYTNATGAWLANETLTSMTSGAAANFTAVTFASDGTILWNVLCNDSAGQEDWAAANYTVKIDSTDPVIALDSPSDASWDADGTVVFTYTPTDTNIDTCILYHNVSSWGANTTNASLTSGAAVTITQALADGTYIWNVLCNDSAGRTAWAAANYTINVDNTDPVVDSLDNPADDSWSTSKTVIFGFTATEANFDTCVLYTNATGAWAANETLTSMTSGAAANFTAVTFASDGTILWNVLCNDSAGQEDWAAANYTVKIDSTDPVIALNLPANYTWQTSNSVTFNYTPTDTNIDTCILYHNVSSWAANTTNSSLTSGVDVTIGQTISDGVYIWNVLCNDSAGRTAWAAANYSLRVDANGPTTSMTALSTYSVETFAVAWSATDTPSGAATYNVQVNDGGAGWTDWLADTALTTSNYGGTNGHTYYFRANATDNAGNEGAFSANTSTTVSTSAPTITFYHNSYGPYASDPGNVINITFEDTDGLDYAQYRIGANGTWTDIFTGSAATSYTALWGVTWANLEEGTNVIYVRAYDDAGNIAEPAQTFDFIKDTTNLTVSITSPVTGDFTDENVTLTVETSETATCQYKVDSDAYAAMAETGTTVHSQSLINLSYGPHTVTVNCTDDASHSITDSETWTVSTGDTTPPAQVTGLTELVWTGGNNRNIMFNWTANTESDLDHYVIYINDYAVDTTQATEYTYAVPYDGTWYVNVSAVDTSGNEGAASTSISITVDITVPSITGTSPTGITTDSTPTLYINTSEAATCKFDDSDVAYASMGTAMSGAGGTEHSYTFTTDLDDSDYAGDYVYYVRCNDTNGNVMTVSSFISFVLDTDGNYNYTQWLYPIWDTLWLPDTGIMGTMGYSDWNISVVLGNSHFMHNDSYRDVYYYNGSAWTGYSPTTGWAGSDLKYVNATNDKPYWLRFNTSVVTTKTRFEI